MTFLGLAGIGLVFLLCAQPIARWHFRRVFIREWRR